MKKISLILILAFMGHTFAYIDPGSGVALIGNLMPLVVAFFLTVFAFLVKTFREPIKRAISKLINK